MRARWQLSFHDALIVAAAPTAGCQRLLTGDLQHGQQIETLTIECPLLSWSLWPRGVEDVMGERPAAEPDQ